MMIRTCYSLSRSLLAIDSAANVVLAKSKLTDSALPRSRFFSLISRLRQTANSKSESSAEGETASNEASKRVAELERLVEEYKEKFLAVEDKYKRQLAETENVRQRFSRQVEEAKLFGNQNFCKDLLEIADVLQLAIESVPKDSLKSADAALKQLYDGLTMTQSQMQKIFSKHGLAVVNPVGEKFNPNIHEAVFQVNDSSKEPNSVATVVKTGYLLHERLIRPAKVGVFVSS